MLPTKHVRIAAWLLLTLLTAGCAGQSRTPVETPKPPSTRPSAPQPQAQAEPQNEPPDDTAEGAAEPAENPTEEAAGAPEEAGKDEEEEIAEGGLLPGEEHEASPMDELAEVPTEGAVPPPVQPPLPEVLAPSFDIPIVFNDRVSTWLDVYSNRHAERFRASLMRSGRYLEMFRKIYAEEGLPLDLIYMAHVESAFKVTAYSRARARGLFQFIASTGRRYGLRVDAWVDERSDPEKAARASAAYLKKLYGDFGDWYLALAAYNAGEGKILRALQRTGQRDFWGIAATRHIRTETKNYVPAIIAATLIAKQPEKYGLSYIPDAPLAYDTIEVEGAADLRVLAECAGSDLETLRELNPALRRMQTPPGATTQVRVPVGRGEQALATLSAIPPSQRVVYVRHAVGRGETLSLIARRYGVSVATIQQTNRLGRRTMIHPGQTLLIPTSGIASIPTPSDYAEESDGAARGQVMTYRVRRGDTLSSIARRYATTPASIAAASGIGTGEVLYVGQRLKVVPGVTSRNRARHIAGRSTAPPPSAVSAGAHIHTVRRGETLWKIAERYNLSIERLCSLNGLTRASVLLPGTRLTVSLD
ncbi:MAG TPA: LysM peptidoglycan-binding domain-containing protein [Candidatus Polarisedimenticolaceae bacterium]|nr:LysM peptidoglycan-binding domain-containing protein [Candidatus Polarisedimenticolaceae bacterium]